MRAPGPQPPMAVARSSAQTPARPLPWPSLLRTRDVMPLAPVFKLVHVRGRLGKASVLRRGRAGAQRGGDPKREVLRPIADLPGVVVAPAEHLRALRVGTGERRAGEAEAERVPATSHRDADGVVHGDD